MIKEVGFDADIKVQHTSINRPELLLRIGIIPKGKRRSCAPLRYIMDRVPSSNDDSIVKPADIPKTVIFFDSKKEAHKAHEELLFHRRVSADLPYH
jgi:hypothetical protein